jgi:hypothetical protein
MKTVRRRIVIAAAIVLIAGLSWLLWNRIRCQQRGAAFARQVETIKRDAQEQLKIGTEKIAVAHFFADHNIPLTFSDLGGEATYAMGTIYTTGCAPVLACGTDSALIGVRVKLDPEGTTTEEPAVVSLYTDCL